MTAPDNAASALLETRPAVAPAPPLALLAELSHRCPLQCPYCSNPTALDAGGTEIDTATWIRVFQEAARMGVLQVHMSGGEPTARKDLPEIMKGASDAGLYTNLITSGVLLDREKLKVLVDNGLNHVQLSFQDVDPKNGDRIGGYQGGHAKKLEVAKLVTEAELPLTLNFVVHRQNLDNLTKMIEMSVEYGAQRMEVAHVQYYGWALANRAALMPTREQLERATEIVDEARVRLKGVLMIDYVVPDYYAHRPKSCMGGWGRQFLNVTPSGKVLPCHAAESLEGFNFPNVMDHSLADIWARAEAFNRFRGTDWMPEPCQSCDRKEIDWGGCRCQAFALTGDAGRTDPACKLAPDHALLEVASVESSAEPPPFIYRRIGGLAKASGPAE
jgi:pyrroloquinoline quinone biosynthesis protein E